MKLNVDIDEKTITVELRSLDETPDEFQSLRVFFEGGSWLDCMYFDNGFWFQNVTITDDGTFCISKRHKASDLHYNGAIGWYPFPIMAVEI